MSQIAYRVGVHVAEDVSYGTQPFGERRVDDGDVLGGDSLRLVVQIDPLVAVQLPASQDVQLVYPGFPFRRRLRLVGVPEVQALPRCAKSLCRYTGPDRP